MKRTPFVLELVWGTYFLLLAMCPKNVQYRFYSESQFHSTIDNVDITIYSRVYVSAVLLATMPIRLEINFECVS